MEYKLIGQDEILDIIGIPEVPNNVSMYYDSLYSIVKTLIEYRDKNGLSQSDLAKKLEVSQAMISKLESGCYNISFKALCDIMGKLGMKVSLNIEPCTDIYSHILETMVDKPNTKLPRRGIDAA